MGTAGRRRRLSSTAGLPAAAGLRGALPLLPAPRLLLASAQVVAQRRRQTLFTGVGAGGPGLVGMVGHVFSSTIGRPAIRPKQTARWQDYPGCAHGYLDTRLPPTDPSADKEAETAIHLGHPPRPSTSIDVNMQTRRPSASSPRRRTDTLAAAGPWLRAAWFAAIAVITVAALLPAFAPSGANHADKWSHFAAYAALGILGMAAFPGRPRLVAAVLMANAVAIELAQSRVPGRSGSIGDVLADAAGIAAGMIAIRLVSRQAGAAARRWRQSRRTGRASDSSA